MEIEKGKRLFYSGDLRAHGRKAKLFEALVRNPPRNIDIMFIEGSSLGRLAHAETFPPDDALEETFIERFRETHGMAL